MGSHDVSGPDHVEPAAAPTNTRSPLKAVRSHCLWCNGSALEVHLCPVKSCPLRGYRFGRKPTAAMTAEVGNHKMYPLEAGVTVAEFYAHSGTALKAIKRRCLDCVRRLQVGREGLRAYQLRPAPLQAGQEPQPKDERGTARSRSSASEGQHRKGKARTRLIAGNLSTHVAKRGARATRTSPMARLVRPSLQIPTCVGPFGWDGHRRTQRPKGATGIIDGSLDDRARRGRGGLIEGTAASGSARPLGTRRAHQI